MNKKSELPKYGGMEDAMIKAGIIGATGYAGQELVRLLLQHKEVEIVWYGSRSYVDKKFSSVFGNVFQIVLTGTFYFDDVFHSCFLYLVLFFLQRLDLVTQLGGDLEFEHLRRLLHLTGQTGDLLLLLALRAQLFLAAHRHVGGDLDHVLHLFAHRPGGLSLIHI